MQRGSWLEVRQKGGNQDTQLVVSAPERWDPRHTITGAYQAMECNDHKQTPGLHAGASIIETRHRRGYDHRIIGQPNYQQNQKNHDLPKELQELAEFEDVAVCAVSHFDVFLIKRGRHKLLDGDELSRTLHMQQAQ